jgi:hypothetical protein
MATPEIRGIVMKPTLLILALALAGCTSAAGRSAVVRYARAEPLRVMEVDESGTYALFATRDISPQASVPLEKGERIGFLRDETTGGVLAIAGDREPVAVNEAQTHYWLRDRGGD